jgi:dTDP-4-amino-4,6-dideoxygalactose transaminase
MLGSIEIHRRRFLGVRKGKEAMQVPLLDVGRGNKPLLAEIQAAFARICESGRFIGGPDVQELEKSICDYTGAKHAIACASGSDAILLALMAYDIGPGDEVICPSFTFFATASAVARLGARPVFVDIDPVTFNLSPAKVNAAITAKTKAIIPVHLFGQCANMLELMALSARHQIPIIEDAAQAIGAKFGGKHAGAMGQVGCFSFYPTKNLGGFGDGGLVTTNEDMLAVKLRRLAAHGMSPRYYHSLLGINSRLDTLQAAVLNVKLPHLEEWATLRRENATRYHKLLTAAGLDKVLALPATHSACVHVWNQYTVRVPGGKRDAIRAALGTAGVGSEIYYPLPLHQQECFANLGYVTGDLPETEAAARDVLSLPIFPELMIEEQAYTVEQLAIACRKEQLVGSAIVPAPKYLTHGKTEAPSEKRSA